MSDSQTNINSFTGDKISLVFSNIPTINNATKDLAFLYQNFVKRVSIPSYNLEMTQSFYMNNVLNNPISKKNDELGDLQVEFFLDENSLNYFNMFQYILRLRYGETDNPSKRRKENLARLYDIKTISLLLLDNQRITRKIIEFSECFIVGLSELIFEFGQAEKVPFVVNFKYQEVFLKDPN